MFQDAQYSEVYIFPRLPIPFVVLLKSWYPPVPNAMAPSFPTPQNALASKQWDLCQKQTPPIPWKLKKKNECMVLVLVQAPRNLLAPSNYSVSSGKNCAILLGSPNAVLSIGLCGVGGFSSWLCCPCGCGKSLSDILFFLMFPCDGACCGGGGLASAAIFTDRTSMLFGTLPDEIVARARWLEASNGVVVCGACEGTDRIRLKGTFGPR